MGLEKLGVRSGDTGQWLRTLASLSGGLGLILSIHKAAHYCQLLQFQSFSSPFLASMGTCHACSTQIKIQAKYLHA